MKILHFNMFKSLKDRVGKINQQLPDLVPNRFAILSRLYRDNRSNKNAQFNEI